MDNERTLELIKDEANQLIKGLKFTIDCQEQNSDGKCPMLDLKVWQEVNSEGVVVVWHTFYEKEVTAPLVFHAKGAHTWCSKLVTLGEEVKRILMNMDRNHTEEEKAVEVEKFLRKMVNSGYGPPTRKEVAISGIRRFYRKLITQESGGPRVYRTPEQGKKF